MYLRGTGPRQGQSATVLDAACSAPQAAGDQTECEARGPARPDALSSSSCRTMGCGSATAPGSISPESAKYGQSSSALTSSTRSFDPLAVLDVLLAVSRTVALVGLFQHGSRSDAEGALDIFSLILRLIWWLC
jgi:hypothetical protein